MATLLFSLLLAAASLLAAAQSREAAAVNSVAWSRDASRLLTATGNGDLALFDAETGELTQRIDGPGAFVVFATFTPDDRQVVAADYAGQVTVFDVATGEAIAVARGHDAEAACLAVSPNRDRFASSDKAGNVVVWSWDGESLAIERRLDAAVGDFANQVAFDPAGRRLATCGSASRDAGTGEVVVFDVATGEEVTRALLPAFANAVEFSGDGEAIYVGLANGTVRGINVSTGGPAGNPDGAGPQDLAKVRVVANDIALLLGDDGQPRETIAAGGDGLLRRANFNGSAAWSVRADPSVCYYAALSPDGSRVATSGNDGALRLFDAADGALIREISLP